MLCPPLNSYKCSRALIKVVTRQQVHTVWEQKQVPVRSWLQVPLTSDMTRNSFFSHSNWTAELSTWDIDWAMCISTYKKLCILVLDLLLTTLWMIYRGWSIQCINSSEVFSLLTLSFKSPPSIGTSVGNQGCGQNYLIKSKTHEFAAENAWCSKFFTATELMFV